MPDSERTSQNLMVVLRESVGGASKNDETLLPMGKLRAKLDGRDVEMEFAWYQFIGDMHIRFVFDAPQMMDSVRADELSRLKLSLDDALVLAVTNIKRVYGKPIAVPLVGGVMQVNGKSSDFDSSYFLDREFWQEQLRQHPSGLVVGVPKRGGLVFAPISDTAAVEGLRRGIRDLYVTSEKLRISSALYLFRDNRWTVFQAPNPAN